MRRVLAGLAAVAIALSAAPSFAQEKLTVWWVEGFYKSEDDALYAAIKAACPMAKKLLMSFTLWPAPGPPT